MKLSQDELDFYVELRDKERREEAVRKMAMTPAEVRAEKRSIEYWLEDMKPGTQVI